MRRTAALQTCLATLLAFFIAPFQHTHPAGSHDDHDHDHHSGLLHAHFHLAASTPARPNRVELVDADDDDDHAVWSNDTFTLRLVARPSLGLPSRGPIVLLVSPTSFHPTGAVEQRGHDPPLLDKTNPRGPPS